MAYFGDCRKTVKISREIKVLPFSPFKQAQQREADYLLVLNTAKRSWR